jgi:hypothetical protein
VFAALPVYYRAAAEPSRAIEYYVAHELIKASAVAAETATCGRCSSASTGSSRTYVEQH